MSFTASSMNSTLISSNNLSTVGININHEMSRDERLQDMILPYTNNERMNIGAGSTVALPKPRYGNVNATLGYTTTYGQPQQQQQQPDRGPSNSLTSYNNSQSQHNNNPNSNNNNSNPLLNNPYASNQQNPFQMNNGFPLPNNSNQQGGGGFMHSPSIPQLPTMQSFNGGGGGGGNGNVGGGYGSNNNFLPPLPPLANSSLSMPMPDAFKSELQRSYLTGTFAQQQQQQQQQQDSFNTSSLNQSHQHQQQSQQQPQLAVRTNSLTEYDMGDSQHAEDDEDDGGVGGGGETGDASQPAISPTSSAGTSATKSKREKKKKRVSASPNELGSTRKPSPAPKKERKSHVAASSDDDDVDAHGQPYVQLKPSEKQACIVCHHAKTSCDGARPCSRCVRLGRESQCEERPRKEHYKKRQKREREEAARRALEAAGGVPSDLPPPSSHHGTPPTQPKALKKPRKVHTAITVAPGTPELTHPLSVASIPLSAGGSSVPSTPSAPYLPIAANAMPMQAYAANLPSDSVKRDSVIGVPVMPNMITSASAMPINPITSSNFLLHSRRPSVPIAPGNPFGMYPGDGSTPGMGKAMLDRGISGQQQQQQNLAASAGQYGSNSMSSSNMASYSTPGGSVLPGGQFFPQNSSYGAPYTPTNNYAQSTYTFPPAPSPAGGYPTPSSYGGGNVPGGYANPSNMNGVTSGAGLGGGIGGMGNGGVPYPNYTGYPPVNASTNSVNPSTQFPNPSFRYDDPLFPTMSPDRRNSLDLRRNSVLGGLGGSGLLSLEDVRRNSILGLGGDRRNSMGLGLGLGGSGLWQPGDLDPSSAYASRRNSAGFPFSSEQAIFQQLLAQDNASAAMRRPSVLMPETRRNSIGQIIMDIIPFPSRGTSPVHSPMHVARPTALAASPPAGSLNSLASPTGILPSTSSAAGATVASGTTPKPDTESSPEVPIDPIMRLRLAHRRATYGPSHSALSDSQRLLFSFPTPSPSAFSALNYAIPSATSLSHMHSMFGMSAPTTVLDFKRVSDSLGIYIKDYRIGMKLRSMIDNRVLPIRRVLCFLATLSELLNEKDWKELARTAIPAGTSAFVTTKATWKHLLEPTTSNALNDTQTSASTAATSVTSGVDAARASTTPTSSTNRSPSPPTPVLSLPYHLTWLESPFVAINDDPVNESSKPPIATIQFRCLHSPGGQEQQQSGDTTLDQKRLRALKALQHKLQNNQKSLSSSNKKARIGEHTTSESTKKVKFDSGEDDEMKVLDSEERQQQGENDEDGLLDLSDHEIDELISGASTIGEPSFIPFLLTASTPSVTTRTTSTTTSTFTTPNSNSVNTQNSSTTSASNASSASQRLASYDIVRKLHEAAAFTGSATGKTRTFASSPTDSKKRSREEANNSGVKSEDQSSQQRNLSSESPDSDNIPRVIERQMQVVCNREWERLFGYTQAELRSLVIAHGPRQALARLALYDSRIDPMGMTTNTMIVHTEAILKAAAIQQAHITAGATPLRTATPDEVSYSSFLMTQNKWRTHVPCMLNAYISAQSEDAEMDMHTYQFVVMNGDKQQQQQQQQQPQPPQSQSQQQASMMSPSHAVANPPITPMKATIS